MEITVTELKQNFDKYLLLAETENILISNNGKNLVMLSNPHADRIAIANALLGVIPADITLEEALAQKASEFHKEHTSDE